MWSRTKRQAGSVVPRHVEPAGVHEMIFITIGRTEHQKHPLFGFELHTTEGMIDRDSSG